MSHVLSETFAAAGNLVIDLRRAGATAPGSAPTAPYYKAVRLVVSAVKNGAAAASFVVAPIAVLDSDPAPSAATLAISASSNYANGVAGIESTNNPTLTMGQSYSPGYSPQVFNEVVATHLLVTCVAAGQIQIVVD